MEINKAVVMKCFKVNDLVPTAGLRTEFKIEQIDNNYLIIRPNKSKSSQSHFLYYHQLTAVLKELPTIEAAIKRGLRTDTAVGDGLERAKIERENTTETYLLGFVREFVTRARLK